MRLWRGYGGLKHQSSVGSIKVGWLLIVLMQKADLIDGVPFRRSKITASEFQDFQPDSHQVLTTNTTTV
jgi:hypothetical protein